MIKSKKIKRINTTPKYKGKRSNKLMSRGGSNNKRILKKLQDSLFNYSQRELKERNQNKSQKKKRVRNRKQRTPPPNYYQELPVLVSYEDEPKTESPEEDAAAEALMMMMHSADPVGPLKLVSGSPVVIVNNEGNELKGIEGTVVQWIEDRGRYEVHVSNHDDSFEVLPDNLYPLTYWDENFN